ncbi:alcohol oxidase [Lindgomyces ingoldianus]|uniref:Alcohol oxidase n=1 Tax=Lindgomyces ingoldianus TaxID=673940 RepID=A0ACB6R6P2_9PLEO|nr:alcohol oxidase [Lindgomyces ingoldianus]KAF2474943.1 alcohol oxidase [Lindgomyces ingoldianus]
MKVTSCIFCTSFLASIVTALPPEPICPKPLARNDSNTYDYIVTGSGPGGGTIATNLARHGYSVLLVEAGDDQSADIGTQILSFYGGNGPVKWDFFVRHSDDLERTKKYNLLTWKLADGSYWVGREPPEKDAKMMGVYYPRGATLGGSAIVNAAATWLPSDSDWDYFDRGVGDGIWSGKDMRKIFERIEHNNYLEPGAPGHGFKGWLQTNNAEKIDYPTSSLKLVILQAALKIIGKDPSKVIDYLTSDGNYLDAERDKAEGLFGLPFHAEKNWKRFSPRDYIFATRNETTANGTQKYQLHLQLRSLATKVLFEEVCGHSHGKPKAIGVEYLEGTAMYKGDSRFNPAAKGRIGQAFARKEVIVSGGTFNSPQLLQLSGIGPKALLQKYNISVIADLPGVGRNLQDNYEMPVVGHAKTNMTTPVNTTGPACTQGAPGDPCVDLWRQGKGPYAHAGQNAWGLLLKSKHSLDGERDTFIFSTGGGAAFRGFAPPTNQPSTDPPTTFSWSTVKIHPQNTAGVIQIKSNNPQDMPDINFNHFVEGADTDLAAILDTVAFGRKAFFGTEAPVGQVTPVEPPCPAADIQQDGYCKDPTPDREWIQNQIFGHHPTSSCAVGPDSNPLAVLDTRLRVRGVERLRVVDASAFPRCPGAFPAVATYMLSEKASDLVLEDAAQL